MHHTSNSDATATQTKQNWRNRLINQPRKTGSRHVLLCKTFPSIQHGPALPLSETHTHMYAHTLHALKALLYGLHKSFSPHFSSQSITTMQFFLNCAVAPWAAAPYALAETRITRAAWADATRQIDYLLERCIGFNISLLSAYMSSTFFPADNRIWRRNGQVRICSIFCRNMGGWMSHRKWKWFLECNWFGSALLTDAHFVARKYRIPKHSAALIYTTPFKTICDKSKKTIYRLSRF